MTLLSNNLVLMSFLSGAYLKSRFSWLGEECRKQWKKEENRPENNTEKWTERKRKNRRRVK